MQITKQIMVNLNPCYSEEQINELAAGRESLTPADVAALDIEWNDKIWLLTRLMNPEQRDRYVRWVALDVAGLWDCPDVVRRWLETGDESLRTEAKAKAAKSGAAWATSEAWATRAAWAATRNGAKAAAEASAWAWSAAWAERAARAEASAWATQKYLEGAVGILG